MSGARHPAVRPPASEAGTKRLIAALVQTNNKRSSGASVQQAGWGRRKECTGGFTLIEVIIALAILSTALVAFYITLSRAILLSETNKQVKVALFDAQAVVEEIQGVPFDEIMDPDYPSPSEPNPRFRHLQYVDLGKFLGINPATGKPNEHLKDEKIRIWYGSQLDAGDANGNSDQTDAKPLSIVPGSDVLTALAPNPGAGVLVEKYRPANNDGGQFTTPDPLYVTVEVTWIGPNDPTPMSMRITFVRSR